MWRQLFGPLRLLATSLVAERSPRQLAAGFALGMVLGLVPKGNLTAVGLGLVLFTCRVNLGAGLLAAAVFSWAGVWFDPAADDLGHLLLGAGWLTPLWTALYNVPVARWSGFNNTVVLGNLGLGLILFYPVYVVSLAVFERIARPVGMWVRKYRLAAVLFGAEVAGHWRVG